jgi:hypothetical protein
MYTLYSSSINNSSNNISIRIIIIIITSSSSEAAAAAESENGIQNGRLSNQIIGNGIVMVMVWRSIGV